MIRRVGVLLVLLAAPSCRNYDLYSRVSSGDGSVPGDQFARYGKEQAEAVAIGREYGKAAQGNSPEALTKQADAAIAYARTLPDVATIGADPQGRRLTISFKSGWRVGVPPIEDGKSGSETVGLGAPAAPAAK
jgi:hypothetical protein